MQVKGGSFGALADKIRRGNKKVVVFGAGAIGAATVPGILREYGVAGAIHCYVDNDESKHGKYISLPEKKVGIFPVDSIEKLDLNDIIILMTLSRYAGPMQQLENMACLQAVECYLIPLMCIANFSHSGGEGIIRSADQPLIPKVIHYIWFGGKPIPSKLMQCIESWRKFCPDYTIQKWDESNYDIEQHPYVKQAYEAGKYSFASDYARIDILYRFGGIYMDADVEVRRNLDELLYQQAFCSVEKWQVINTGGCFGAVKNHPAVCELLREREQVEFINEDGSFNLNASGYYDTHAMMRNGYRMNGKTQTIMGMNIYTYDYFHPYDYMSGCVDITSDTYAVHHFNGGWLDESMHAENECAKKAFEELYVRLGESRDEI